MSIRIASVPYVNAMPLVWDFEQHPERGVCVEYAVPSQLPAKLDSGAVEAILVSSIDALLTPGREIAGGVCIASRGAVQSVRLISQVPFDLIRRLALDQSSMTSNALAQLILANVYGVKPETAHAAPNLQDMLRDADAAVLIGDIGMTAATDGYRVLDLGQAWVDWTGLPFVWAAWVGRSIRPELGRLLVEAVDRTDLEEVAQDAARRDGWNLTMARDYLCRTMTFRFDPEIEQGLRTFHAQLKTAGWPVVDAFPPIISLNPAAV